MDTGVGPGPGPGQKRKSQSSENEWVEHWSPRKTRMYWYNPSTGDSVWKKPLSPAQPAISSSQSFEDFLKQYEEYNKSFNNIDGRHFAEQLITSKVVSNTYQGAIEYLSDLLKSYISYKLKTSGSNLTIRDILYFNVHGTGHGGAAVAMSKDINPRSVPDTVYMTTPSGLFAWKKQKLTGIDFFRNTHLNGKPLTRREKTYYRQLICDNYKMMNSALEYENECIESSLSKLATTKEDILTELKKRKAKVNVVGRIATSMAWCPKWNTEYPKDEPPKKGFYTEKEKKHVKTLFSTAERFLNETHADIQEKCEHSSLGVERSMAESFKCYDLKGLTFKPDIGQCFQNLSSGPDDWQQSYPNFYILAGVHTGEYEIDLMLNAMFNKIQLGNESLFENIEGYKLNEKGFPFLIIKHLYNVFLNKSPDYRKISLGNFIYPTKLFDLLYEIGKVSTYGSFCCRKGHDVDVDGLNPYDSEGGRRKTRKRVRGNKRNRGKTRGRK